MFFDLVGMLVVGEEAVVDLEEVFLWQIQRRWFHGSAACGVVVEEADWLEEVFIMVMDVFERIGVLTSRAGC